MSLSVSSTILTSVLRLDLDFGADPLLTTPELLLAEAFDAADLVVTCLSLLFSCVFEGNFRTVALVEAAPFTSLLPPRPLFTGGFAVVAVFLLPVVCWTLVRGFAGSGALAFFLVVVVVADNF